MRSPALHMCRDAKNKEKPDVDTAPQLQATTLAFATCGIQLNASVYSSASASVH